MAPPARAPPARSTSASTRRRRSPRPRATSSIAKRGARPRRPRGRQLPHGHRQRAERAARLRRGRHLLRAPVLRLHADEPRRRPTAASPALGDDSATYLWRVMAAREIMRLYRSDPAQLDRDLGAADREELRRGGPASRGRDRALRRRPTQLRDGLRRRPHRRAAARAAARARRRDRPRDGRAGRPPEALAHDVPRAAPAGARPARLHRRGRQGDLRRTGRSS